MNGKSYCLWVVMFVLSRIAVCGQGVNTRTRLEMDRIYAAGYAKADAYAVTSFAASPYCSLTKVMATFGFRDESKAYWPQEGDGGAAGSFHAASLVRLDKIAAVQGNVTYERGAKKHVKWNETSDFKLLYPYVMADSVGGTLQNEQYAFRGRYAGARRRLVYGIEGNYRALHEYRQVDPRPKNITSDFSTKVSAGVMRAGYLASLSASYRRYHQSQGLTFLNPIGANTSVFHFTGLGTHYARFESTGTFTSVRYRGREVSVSALLQPLGQKKWFAGLSYGRFKIIRHLQAQNEAPLSELLLQRVSAFATYGKEGKTFTAAVSLEGNYELRQGTENVIDNLSSGYYNDLAGLTMYGRHEWDVKCQGPLVWRGEKRSFSLVPQMAFYASRAAYLFPERKMAVSRLSAGLTADMTLEKAGWLYDFCCSAGYGAHLGGECVLDQDHTMPRLYEAYGAMYEKWIRGRTAMGAELLLQREVNAKNAVFLKTSVKEIIFAGGDHATYVFIATGLAF